MVQVFFSYSHADEELRNELDKHLAMLKRQGIIDTWHDRMIAAGTAIDETIDQYLETANIILCLLSPDFIASDYCFSREMKRALQRHDAGEARVIPIILRHCEWEQTPLSALRGTPRDNKPILAWNDRDEAFKYVVQDIRSALTDIGAKSSTAVSIGMDVQPQNHSIQQRPRSGNLRINKAPTDLERDEFISEAFEYIYEFLANSIDELRSRNDGVDGRLKRLDANRITAALYKDGKKRSAITIFTGGLHGGERQITFNMSDAGQTNMSNGGYRLTNGERGLLFADAESFLGINVKNRGSSDKADVAESLWTKLIEPLQQQEGIRWV